MGHRQVGGFRQSLEHELHPDEAKDDRQAPVEVHDLREEPVEQEEELPQAHEGESIGREDEVGLFGEAEDRRDRVDGEEQIRGADRQHDEQHGRDMATSVETHGELCPVVLPSGRYSLLQPADERIALGIRLLAVAAPDLHRGVEQQGSEEEERAREPCDRLGADDDEDAPEHERDHDAHEQDSVTLLRRDGEGRDDHHEDEEVVHAEGVLGDVSGEELTCVRRPEVPEDEAGEGQGEGDVEDHPARRLARAEDVRATVDEDEVEGDDAHEPADRRDPHPCGDVHAWPASCIPRSSLLSSDTSSR